MKKQLTKKAKPTAITPSSQNKKKLKSASAMSNFIGSNLFFYLLLAFVVIAVSVVRWRLVAMPLERDEGEYAYIGHLILNGVTPYQEAYNMKLPGTYYMYALIMSLFGETYKGIHTGLLLLNAASMILFFQGFKRFFNPTTALLTAGFYGLMAMSHNVFGFAAHATHFAVFYIAASIYFFSKYDERKSLLYVALTGAMLGLAFLMKQHAVYFILFGGIVFVIFQFLEKPLNIRKLIVQASIFSFGVFIPYLLVVMIMLATGTFERFWFWTVTYASKYASGVPWEQAKEMLSSTLSPIWKESIWIWILAIIGVVTVLFTKFSVKQKIMAISFAVFSMLATTPGFYFRQHYFIIVLPAVALMAGITLDYAGRFITDKLKIKALGLALPLLILFLIFNATLEKDTFYYSTKNPELLCKAIYGANPFTESITIAKYIAANSSDSDKVAVLGSEPQIPFYAKRRSASGHIYMYGLMEIHEYNVKMQEEMISEIEKSKPLFMVFCNVPFSWLTKPNSPMKIFEWYSKYASENYNVVGLIDIPNQGPSSFYWNNDANRTPLNKNSVWILKRK